uniref:Uncharacterized protein n=1 Tax=Ignisphaera aggregans TaxID=334771 RepID=A0A7C4FCZ9_9CREN
MPFAFFSTTPLPIPPPALLYVIMVLSALLFIGNLEAVVRLCFSSHINTTSIHTNHSIGKALSTEENPSSLPPLSGV